MARARRLAAAGAVTAFAVGGLSMAVGIGTATAAARQAPTVAATCLIPLIACDEPSSGGSSGDPWEPQPQDSWSSGPAPQDSWSSGPAPQDSWSSGPGQTPQPTEPEPDHPWKPVDEDEHKIPDGAPQTGGGALASDPALWPFTVGGVALLAGGGLAGFALRRRRS
ncbi:hypothetical protein ACIBG8_32210 [Nonomuraea sp. NPDC050556]|uniref:hypothetical protein n=1 Tax=Nonomuraea sp. NPDC050556 TaxID=3364369 RepID=UPI0037B562F4